MKIGFDISQTGKSKAGCGYFADSLIRSLAEIDSENHYILYPTFGDMYWDPDWRSEICQIHRPNFKYGPGHKNFEVSKSFWNHPSGDFEDQIGNPDILHANNFYCPKGLNHARIVYTLYDLSFLICPEWTTEENRITCFHGVFYASLYADMIIAISEYSRKHFLEVFPHYPADRIIVVYPASRFSEPRNYSKEKKPLALKSDEFWLSVGVLEPRKNHKGLLQAYARLKADQGKTFPLVLVGGQGWLMEDFEREINALKLREDVVRMGYVEDGELKWLFQNCFAFIYPSFFEGFGLPVLEAMSLGAPVIASRVSSIPEVTGQAGILIDPYQFETICKAMRKLSNEAQLRIQLREKAIEQSSKFSWRTAASLALQSYQEVMNRERLSEYLLKNRAVNI